MTEILETTFLGNTVQTWAIAVALALGISLALGVAVRWVAARFRSLSERTRTTVDDLLVELLGRTKVFFYAAIGVYVGIKPLALSENVDTIVNHLVIMLILVQGGLWANAAVSSLLESYREDRLQEDPAAATTIGALGFVARLAVWSLVLVLALDNLGVDITALVTGLGIGGIALALAVQNVLGDLFASLAIVLDKPFVIGDFIIVGDLMGTVERIGLKTTRVRSLSGEQIIFSNSDLLSSRVRNYKRMYERRIVFAFGVTYQTAPDTLEEIPETVRQIIEAQSDVRFDRCHFKSFGGSSLDFEAVYYVLLPDYNVYMDRQQAINLGIMRAFEEQGVEFAYPTQTVYVSRLDTSEPEQQ
jgi:small-conductance mechanosensitive channel